MGGQEAFLTVFGDLQITDILIYVLALGYIVPQVKKGYIWLRNYLKGTEAKETALKNAQNLEKWHGQSEDIRGKLQGDIDENKKDIADLKTMKDTVEALRLGVQALLRDSIISTYNKYHDKGYMPIWARENLTRAYEAYTGLGGNDVAHSLYEKMLGWPTDPEGKEVTADAVDKQGI